MLFSASGGIFEATRYANACEVSRPTISNYLSVLEATYVAHVVRPFSTRKSVEIVAAPKVYGFDTGFVCYFRGWQQPRADDLGVLWEHYVLNELHARLQSRRMNYWRDKHGHEVDFICARRGRPPLAIESRWSAENFEPGALKAFALHYPKAECFVVTQDTDRTATRRYGDLKVSFVSLESLVNVLAPSVE
jgi:uncharacterized protein